MNIKYYIPFVYILLSAHLIAADPQKTTIIDESNFCCCYMHIIHTYDRDSFAATDSIFSILQISDNMTKYGDHLAYILESKDTTVIKKKAILDFPRFNEYLTIYQNYPQGEITVHEAMFPAYYLYKEPMNKLQWSLSEDTLRICGYLCKKAITDYAGRKWSAWYTDEIPSATGPWKLHGLPGLILQAEDTNGEHLFKAYTFYQCKQKITFCPTPKDMEINRNKFIAYRNRIKTDPQWIKDRYYYARNAIRNTFIRHNPKTKIAEKISIDGFAFSPIVHHFIPLELK